MQSNWHVLIPPAIVLILSFVTKQVNIALLAGILSAAFIVAHYAPLHALHLMSNRLWLQISDADNLYLFSFLLILGAIIVFMTHTGGTAVYSRLIQRHVRSKQGVELSSLTLSLFFFLDDYFSSLTVGSVMRKITDEFKIPRVKLAFLINAIAPSLAILPPISSWIAMLLSQITQAGFSENPVDNPYFIVDPFIVYAKLVPYMLYSFIIILSTWFIVLMKISYGPMHEQEEIAQKTGNLFGGKEPLKKIIEEPHDHHGSIGDFLVPISLLIITIPCAIMISGGYSLFGGNHSFIAAIAHANIFKSLFIGSLFSLLVSVTYYLVNKKVAIKNVPSILHAGIMLMYQSIIILLLAGMFSQFIKTDLMCGQYLAHSVLGSCPIMFLPFLFFVLSTLISMITGSSWGTIMVLLPLAIPMIIQLVCVPVPANITDVTILLPSIGAILSGAVAGTHLSPIADNMVMSSTSSGCYHIDHVRTQTWYVLPVICATGIAFIVLGLLHHMPPLTALLISFGVGLFLSCASLMYLQMYWKKKSS